MTITGYPLNPMMKREQSEDPVVKAMREMFEAAGAVGVKLPCGPKFKMPPLGVPLPPNAGPRVGDPIGSYEGHRLPGARVHYPKA